jgi:hypothetical protein
MWIEGNYRRIFLDLHIDDWNDEFLSKLLSKQVVLLHTETAFLNI